MMTDLHEDFRQYCEENASRLLRTAYGFSRKIWDAEDALQETLLKHWCHWGNEEYRKRVRDNPGFSVTCVINALRDNWRSAKSRTERQEKEGRKVVDPPDDYSRVDGEDNFSRMLGILEGLNPTWRLVILLRYEREFTLVEVACALGISEATARRYERRALEALKEADKGM